MSLHPYPKYKDSGVEWLGEVPEHWRVERLKHTVRLVTEKAVEKTNPIALENIESWSARLIPSETEFEGDGTAFQRGDILFGKLRPYLAKAYLAESNGEAVGDFHVLRPSGQVQGRFLIYYLLNRDTIDIIDGSTFGAKMPRVNWEFLGNMPIPIAPTAEQTCLIAFLNRETEKIDTLVEEQQRLIELLKEKRQAVISHAVTKGLNPDTPMKDSGIEWLGQIPAHWRMKPLKHASPNITVGIVVEPSKYYCDVGVPALRSLNVLPGRIVEENLVFISPAANALLEKSRLRAGDLVVVRSGQPGTAAVIPPELDGCNCIDLIIIRKPVDGDGRFLCWYLASDHALRQFTEGAEGAIQQHFNVGTAMNLVAPVPPVWEQEEIVEFIDRETTKIDELTQRATYAIDLLQERRTALISAAVTGKIDVRGLATEEAA